MFKPYMVDGLAAVKLLSPSVKEFVATPYFFKKQLTRLLAIAAVLTLTACGGGGGGGGGDSDSNGGSDGVVTPEVDPPEATMQIDGSVTKGLLRSALVEVYSLRGSTLLASGRTDSVGRFNLEASENDLLQAAGDNPLGVVLRVQVNGDAETTMICDADCGDVAMGDPVAAPDLMLEGTAFASFSDASVTVHLNVFTTLMSAANDELGVVENVNKQAFDERQKSTSDLLKSLLELLVDENLNLAVAEVPPANELDPLKHDKDTQLLSIVNASFADNSHPAGPGATIEIIRLALQSLIKDELNNVDVDPAAFDTLMLPVKTAAGNVVTLVEASIGSALDTDLADDLIAEIGNDLQKNVLSDFVVGGGSTTPTPTPPPAPTGANYFVASDGLDSNSGVIESPFLSISKATELATAGDSIFLRGGTYTQTIDISGLTGTEEAPITISAYQNEQVIFDGTKTIAELGGGTWTLALEEDEFPGTTTIYKTTLTEDTWQLFVDKKIQIPARWPNAGTHPTDPIVWKQEPYDRGEATGYLAVKDSWWHKPSTWANADAPGTIGDLGTTGLGYNQTENNPGTMDEPLPDLAGTGKSFTGGTLIYSFLKQGGDGNQERLIDEHVAGTNIIKHAGYTGPGTRSGHGSRDKYFIIEHLQALDQPGEWYYVHDEELDTKTLYLWPENDGDLLKVHGRVKAHHLIGSGEHVTIRGIKFFAGTFNISGDHLSIQDSHFSYPDSTKRMLGLHATKSDAAMRDYGSVLTDGDHFLFKNNVFEYSEMGIALKANDAFEAQFINNLFQYISMWGLGNNGLVEFAPTFVRNTVRYSGMRSPFKSTEAGVDKSLRIQSYNRLNHWGLLQVDDGAGLQVSGESMPGTIRKYNWFLRTPMYGSRWDGKPANNGGTNHHSVAMGMRGGFQVKGNEQGTYNNTAFNSVRDIGKTITKPIIIGQFKNDIIVVSDSDDPNDGGIKYGGNLGSITLNNLADTIGDDRIGSFVTVFDIPGIYYNENNENNEDNRNWNGYSRNPPGFAEDRLLVEDLLVDPENLDFRPKESSGAIIDKGEFIAGITEGFIGDAPDFGAYEFGRDEYWIPGYQAPQATTPIPGDGAVGLGVDRDLMYLSGYEADEVKVYFGTDIGSLSLIAARSNPDKNILVAGQDFSLSLGETYYWRVDTILADGSVITGDVWTFSTGP